MAAFLTSLAQLGSQYGEAKEGARQEKQALAEKAQKMDVEQAYLRLAQESGQRQQQELEQRIKTSRYMKVGDRLWDVQESRWADIQQPDPYENIKKFVATLDKKVQQRALAAGEAALEANPGHPKAAVDAVLRIADEAHREETRQAEEVTKHQEHEQDLSTSRQFQHQEHADTRAFQQQMRDEQRDFVKGMFEARREGITPAAEKVLYSVEPVISQLDRMRQDIHNLGLDNNNQSGYLFPARLKYAFGSASPEGTLAKDIAGLSLGSVIEAASAIQGTSRSLQALKLAAVHTPNAWKDSPQLIRQKLEEIRKRLVDITNDAKKYGTKSGQVPPLDSGEIAPQQNSDPLGVLK